MSDMDNTNDTANNNTNVIKKNILDWILIYINEVFEAFVSILIIRVAIDKPIDIHKLLKASLAIGVVTSILENYNHDFQSNIKQGITFSVGAQMISHFMN